MKKLCAIAMLALLLFNMGGYMLLFQYLIYRSDSSVSDQINHNRYQSSDLVEIKIPVHLNIQDWSEYVVINGQVKLKDTSYNYAELKMTRDTMYLKCIPNHEKGRLVNANMVYGKQVNDIPLGKKAHPPLVKKSITENEYIYTVINFRAFIPAEAKKAWYNHGFCKTIQNCLDFDGQPPEACNRLS